MRRRISGLACLLGLASVAALSASSMPYHDGDAVVVTGIVTDGQGRTLPAVTVVLEASRTGFDVRTFSREKRDAQRTAVQTDARGEYSLSWTWAGYYNHFELLVGLPYKRPGGAPGFLTVDQQDLTPRLKGGSPVVAAVTVRDTGPIDAFRTFVAGLKTADQRRTYETMGRPEQIDRLVLPGGVEETWWYFEAGKSFRFRDGAQLDMTPFDPVQRF